MQIAEQLVTLAELAAVDQKARAVNEKLETVPALAKKADVEAAALQKQVDDARKKKEGLEKERRLLDGQLVDERAKLKKWEARADGLRGEREHSALASEIGTQKREMGRIEDRMLELMQ